MKITIQKILLKLRLSRISLAVLLVLLATFSSSMMAKTLQEKVNEYLNTCQKLGKFSGSILISKDGKILISKGYGMANYELDVPNTPQTKFRLGSITKQFTATAIMQLQEKGLLNVKDPIIKYIPDYPNGDKITLHHLLTHTSGIRDLTSFPDHRKYIMIPSPVEKTILRFKNKPLEFSPGEQFKYCNSGYILLGYIIEKISGNTYEEYLKNNIFKPLNMINSGYDHPRTILKHRASGYIMSKEGLINGPYNDMSAPYAAGGLYSTVEDLYRLDRALYTEKILKKSSLDKMFTPFKRNYGYGWRINTIFGHKRVYHAGAVIGGFGAYIARFIEDNTLIVFLCNVQPVNLKKISKDLATIKFGETYELPRESTAINTEIKKEERNHDK